MSLRSVGGMLGLMLGVNETLSKARLEQSKMKKIK